jgi:hypothetical protein
VVLCLRLFFGTGMASGCLLQYIFIGIILDFKRNVYFCGYPREVGGCLCVT